MYTYVRVCVWSVRVCVCVWNGIVEEDMEGQRAREEEWGMDGCGMLKVDQGLEVSKQYKPSNG